MRAVILTTLAVLLLSSCAGAPYTSSYGPFRVDPPFWTRNGEQLRIVMRGPGEMEVWRSGADAVLSQIVADTRDEGLPETVMDACGSFRAPVSDVVDAVERGFRDRGFEAESIIDPSEDQGADEPPLVLHVNVTWGAGRDYEELVPLSAQRVCFEIQGTLSETREVLHASEDLVYWRTTTTSCESLPRHWRDEEAKPLIAAAVQHAWNDASSDFTEALFKWQGKWGFQKIRSGYVGGAPKR